MKTVKDLAIISMLTAILFVQEELLSFIPNLQFTFFLIILYASVLGFTKSLFIITIHTLLDNLFMGSFNIFIMLPMFIGYFIIVLVISLIKTRNNLILALISIPLSILCMALYIIPSSYVFGMDLKAYIIADIPYDIILVCVNFILTILLFNPLYRLLNNLLGEYEEKEEKQDSI